MLLFGFAVKRNPEVAFALVDNRQILRDLDDVERVHDRLILCIIVRREGRCYFKYYN